MTTSRITAWVVLLGVIPAAVSTAIRGPGKYCSMLLFDRWDGCTL